MEVVGGDVGLDNVGLVVVDMVEVVEDNVGLNVVVVDVVGDDVGPEVDGLKVVGD